jgi:hypothetical protein
MQYDTTKRPSLSSVVGLLPPATSASSGEHPYDSFGQEEVKCRACMAGLSGQPMLDCDVSLTDSANPIIRFLIDALLEMPWLVSYALREHRS